MTKDDPFGLLNDTARTRIRPPPNQRAQAATSQPNHQTVSRTKRNSRNILIAAFASLLELAPELESTDPPAEAEALRVRLLEELTLSRDRAVAEGAALHRADSAGWFVAALIDDIVLNTPWGGNSSWPRQPLVVALSGDVDSGTQFFERLEELQRYPGRDPELLQLSLVCLSLGFRGKHRVAGRSGHTSLAEVRATTARLLRNPDEDEAALSPHWQGVSVAAQSQGFIVPLWAIALMGICVIFLSYTFLSIQLSSKSDRLFDLARALPPVARAEIFRPIETEVTIAKPFLPVSFDLLPLFQENAPKAVAAALSGNEDVSMAVLRVQATSPEVFRSARADVNTDYIVLINSIAEVITENQAVIGGVIVVGHTDSIPVQRTNPFASNQGLSEARAKRIAEMLGRNGVPAEIIKFEGRAATESIGDNGTRSGRAKNRRVEIIIQKRL